MGNRRRLIGLISGATGVLALFAPFSWDKSPVGAILFVLSSGTDRDLLWIAPPALLAIPIAVWQVRRLVTPQPSHAETVIAYILSTISMLPVLIISGDYLKHAQDIVISRLEDVIQIAALIVYWCAVVGNVSLLVRNRRHRVPAGVVAEAYLLLGYLPNALYALIAFSSPWWDWDWGAYIVLATCALYVAQVLSLLRSGSSPSRHPGAAGDVLSKVP